MASQPDDSIKKTENTTHSTVADENEISSKEYVIYPVDGHDIDSISSLLASYPPNTKVIGHNSVSGWGMMYWVATLSPAQAEEVSLNKQVRRGFSR